MNEPIQDYLNRVCPGVKMVKGEPLVFEVQSKSCAGVQRRVEMNQYCPNGSCTCPKFLDFGIMSKLERGESYTSSTVCEHIRRVRLWMAIIATYNLSKAVERGMHASVELLLEVPEEYVEPSF